MKLALFSIVALLQLTLNAAPVLPSRGFVQEFDSVVQLLSTSPTQLSSTFTAKGLFAINDGLGGKFYYYPSDTSATNETDSFAWGNGRLRRFNEGFTGTRLSIYGNSSNFISNLSIEGMVIDSRALGARGDGVTDDTAAVQTGIDYLAAHGGGVIKFPIATNKLGKLLINDSGIVLQGTASSTDGSCGTTWVPVTTSQYFLQFGNDTKRIYRSGTENIRINGGAATNGIYLAGGSKQCFIKGGSFNNIDGPAILNIGGVNYESDKNEIWSPEIRVGFNSTNQCGIAMLFPQSGSYWTTGLKVFGGSIYGPTTNGYAVIVDGTTIQFIGTYTDVSGGHAVAMRRTGTATYNAIPFLDGNAEWDTAQSPGEVLLISLATSSRAIGDFVSEESRLHGKVTWPDTTFTQVYTRSHIGYNAQLSYPGIYGAISFQQVGSTSQPDLGVDPYMNASGGGNLSVVTPAGQLRVLPSTGNMTLYGTSATGNYAQFNLLDQTAGTYFRVFHDGTDLHIRHSTITTNEITLVANGTVIYSQLYVDKPISYRWSGAPAGHDLTVTAGPDSNTNFVINTPGQIRLQPGGDNSANIYAATTPSLYFIEYAGGKNARIYQDGVNMGITTPTSGAGALNVSASVLNVSKVTLTPITKAQKTALTPAEGMIVMQSDTTPGLRVYQGGAWVMISTVADP